jgi:argininosuccinate lyase
MRSASVSASSACLAPWFRLAHERVARLVTQLESKGRTVADLTAHEWAALDPRLGPEAAADLTSERSVARRNTPGGPAPASVRAQIAEVRARVGVGPAIPTRG